MAKVKVGTRKISKKRALIVDQLAKFLAYSEKQKELPKKLRKIYVDGGVILKHFSKSNNLDPGKVERAVRDNLFFELSTSSVVDSLIFKQPKELTVARFTELDKVGRLYRANRERMLDDARSSSVLITRLMRVVDFSPLGGTAGGRFQKPRDLDFTRTKWNAENIYSTYLPEDFEKYREESKQQLFLEKKFNAKFEDSETFKFSNDLVATSMMSWYQSLLISDAEIVKDHLMSGEFEKWLRESASERELANICSNLTRQFEERKPRTIDLKREMIRRLRRTSYESSIYNTITKPLLNKLESTEPVTVQEAATKLMELGDKKAVEGLIENLFDSHPETRKVVMEALGVIGDPRAVPPLIKIVEHSRDPGDNLIALWTLSKFDDDRARDFIKKTAKEGEGKVSERAKQIIKNWKRS
jgi:hypothetical protein